MTRYPFKAAYTQLFDLYGIEITPDEFETMGVIAWDKIGNKEYKLYSYTAIPYSKNNLEYYVDLPCNAGVIEAITGDFEDYQYTSNQLITGETQSGWTEAYVESRKAHTNSLYPSGQYLKYYREGNRIRLATQFSSAHILYKGYIADEEGLPYLSAEEVNAVALFCASVTLFKEALKTKDNATLQLSQMLEQKWLKACTQARIPEHINQNEMDEILNVAASWDRKRFGKSFKPIR